MELKISSPCPKTWEELVGNDRVRYCSQCKLNVYNLAEMKPAEVEAIVRKTSGRLCGQLYVRPDRKATLRDCEKGRGRMLTRRIWKAAVAVGLLILGLGSRRAGRPDLHAWPIWVQVVGNWIDPEPKPPVRKMLGDISCVPPAPKTPVPTAGP